MLGDGERGGYRGREVIIGREVMGVGQEDEV